LLIVQNRFDILLEIRLSGVAGQGYTMLYGKCQIIQGYLVMIREVLVKNTVHEVAQIQMNRGPFAALGKVLRKFCCIGLITVMMLLLGCSSSGPKYSEIASRVPPLSPEKGRIWFYLLKQLQGATIRTSEGQELCSLAKYGSSHYVASFVDLPPREYTMNNGMPIARQELRTRLAPGETKYIQLVCEPISFMGAIAIKFRIMPAEIAIPDIAQCRYVGDMALLQSVPVATQEGKR
jgi:hypothetical protein